MTLLIRKLDFKRIPGLGSPHLQMVLAQFCPCGQDPGSQAMIVQLEDGDRLSCEVTNPEEGKQPKATIVMIHGLGGDHQSGYLIRLARKFSQDGYRVVRVNLRGCGSGKGMSTLPYNSGTSKDVLTVLKIIKGNDPDTKIILIGFSLGGNLGLKLAGELGEQGKLYLDKLIAVCPILDLYQSVRRIEKWYNWLYHRYYLLYMLKQSEKWLPQGSVRSIYEYDDKVVAPLWKYKDAMDYYQKCSSIHFIGKIAVPCHLLFAADDPFIDYTILEKQKIPESLTIWVTPYGGHMGFLGWKENSWDIFWMDHTLQMLIKS